MDTSQRGVLCNTDDGGRHNLDWYVDFAARFQRSGDIARTKSQ
jgi:hypothetical protein